MRKILLPPVMLVLCLIGIVTVNYFGLANIILLSGPVKFIGYALIALGIFLPIWGARLFHQHKTNLIPYKNPDKIVTIGPFGFSRNPMYLGMLVVLLGVAVRYGTALSFLFPVIYFSVANGWYIPFEEDRMQDAFGDEFTAYKAKVRRWL
ncbi:MAG: isoprenylcysteine carboxylmethyltransferase family protein [Emcibacter sp.]|nr:isoprenylcysteine carboxylmethyltransferase family protein [Emcibacter sp.]